MPSDAGNGQESVLEASVIVLPREGLPLARYEERSGESYKDPVGAYLATLSTEKSRKTAVESMRRIARALGVQIDPRDHGAWRRIPWAGLGYAETNMVRAQMVATTKPATARLTLSVLKRVLRACFRLGLMTSDRYQKAVDLDPIKGQSARPGRELLLEDMEQLERHFATLEEPYRQMVRAVFALGIGGGLRREELARVLLENVAGDTLRFIGKGQKEAVQRLEPWAVDVLGEWLKARAAAGYRAVTLFLRYDRAGDVLLDAPMRPAHVWELVVQEARAAGVKKIMPHDLRRTFGTRLIREKDPLVAKVGLRHVSLTTTERYDRRAEDELADAMATMKPMMGAAQPLAPHWAAFVAYMGRMQPGKNAKNAPDAWLEAFLRQYRGDAVAARAEVGGVLRGWRASQAARG
jgi:integrase/recombinase XerD